MPKHASISKVETALEQLALQMGLELVDVELKKEAGGVYLRIYIDHDQPGGLKLGECEQYHRACLPLVDAVEYDFLECSSPGIDRPLRRERDFLKHIGQQIEVRLFQKQDGKKVFTGALTAYKDGCILLDCADGQKKQFAVKETALVKPVINYDQYFKESDHE